MVGQQADCVPRLRGRVLDEQQHVDNKAQRAQQGRHAQQGQQDLSVQKCGHSGCRCIEPGVQPGSPGLQLAEGGSPSQILQQAGLRSRRGGRLRRRCGLGGGGGSRGSLSCGGRLADACVLGQHLSQRLEVLALPLARSCKARA